jgi:hypothetical protein
VAGVDRHSDFFVDLGDSLTTNPFIYQDVWLLPHLRFKTSGGHRVATGTLVGNYVRALIPTAPKRNYEQNIMAQFQLAELPPEANADSFRPGVCNMLATTNPTEINGHTTGINPALSVAIPEPPALLAGLQSSNDWMCFLCIRRPQ